MAFTGKEPSPKGFGYLARNEKVGKRRKGKNGKIWVIKLRSNNTKYWALPSAKSSDDSSLKKRTTTSKPKEELFRIRLCEPFTMANNKNWSVDFSVTAKMYKKLLKRPKIVRKKFGRLDIGNAYVFGKQFSLKQYKFLGHQGNDMAQTGLLDITNAKKEELTRIVNNLDNIPMSKFKHWDNEEVTLLARKVISHRILFIGETDGGDVGADLYAHYDSDNKIDGIIIDNNYFFREDLT